MRYSYNTVSLTTPEDGKPITIATPSGTEITSSSTVAADPSTPDGDAAYPLGLVDFSFTTSHVDNLVTLAFVTDLTANWRLSLAVVRTTERKTPMISG